MTSHYLRVQLYKAAVAAVQPLWRQVRSLQIPPDSFRFLPLPSVTPSAPFRDSFRLLPTPSDSFDSSQVPRMQFLCRFQTLDAKALAMRRSEQNQTTPMAQDQTQANPDQTKPNHTQTQTKSHPNQITPKPKPNQTQTQTKPNQTKAGTTPAPSAARSSEPATAL